VDFENMRCDPFAANRLDELPLDWSPERARIAISAVNWLDIAPSGAADIYALEFQNDNNPEGDGAFRYAVTPGYLETMQIPLLRGRLLNERDTRAAPGAVLISESLAQREFPGHDPIGQRVRSGPDRGNSGRAWGTIVGVVGNIKQGSLQLGETDAYYVTNKQWAWADNVLSLSSSDRIQETC